MFATADAKHIPIAGIAGGLAGNGVLDYRRADMDAQSVHLVRFDRRCHLWGCYRIHDVLGGIMRRPRNSVRMAIEAVLSDGVPRGANEIGKLIGIDSRNSVRQALQQAARSGYVVRDGLPLHLSQKERLWSLPQYEDNLPQSDNPWYEE